MAIPWTIRVTVDTARVAANAAQIKAQTGVALIAVVKADAYGLGAKAVAQALVDVVDGFYVFSLDEAIAADLPRLGRPIMAMASASNGAGAPAFAHHRVRPIVVDPAQAAVYRVARPILSVDTGMGRLGCDPDHVAQAIEAGHIDQAMTHASHLDQPARLVEAVGALRPKLMLHAAASDLIAASAADTTLCLDGVRPGIALFRNAVTVAAPLVEVRRLTRPAGYSRFNADHVGVIPGGYAHGLMPGPCVVNGRPSRLIEVGMQSAFVATEPSDRVGDPVTLVAPEGMGPTLDDWASHTRLNIRQILLALTRSARTT